MTGLNRTVREPLRATSKAPRSTDGGTLPRRRRHDRRCARRRAILFHPNDVSSGLHTEKAHGCGMLRVRLYRRVRNDVRDGSAYSAGACGAKEALRGRFEYDREEKLENVWMVEKPQGGVSTAKRTISTLRELIGALDRRVPHIGRPGELRIARDAEMLRREAVAQIEALNRQAPDDKPYDQELVDAIMTDDGGPSPERDTHMQSSRSL